jgi:hypothetical protein
MPQVVSALLALIATLFQSRASLYLKNLALRHQLAVYQHTVSRPRLRPTDRLLWVWLSRLWRGWQDTLAFVQPRTVLAWQQKRFRDHWRRLSQSRVPGRPAIAEEVRALIRNMSRANPNMGIEEIVIAPKSPWQNPSVERLIGSIRRECLDHVVVLHERHLTRLLTHYFAMTTVFGRIERWTWMRLSHAQYSRLRSVPYRRSRSRRLASSLRTESCVSRCHRSLLFSAVTSFRD